MVQCQLEKNSLNSFICDLSFLKKLFPIHTHRLIPIHEFLKSYDWLFLEFESFLKSWMSIGNKFTNNFIFHLSFFQKLSPIHTHPLIPIHEFFKFYDWLFFLVRVIPKRLNVNWKQINSIILFVNCHSLRNFLPLIHITSYPFMNFWNHMIAYLLSLSHS